QLIDIHMAIFQIDPLSNWTEQSDEFYRRMLERINIFATAMANMVKYSFIIEPGTITPHLSVKIPLENQYV
ncbi:unnamed protein product, partial [Onchocerca ochengi]|uniref:DHC_N1 domain-containing protein n=1 Tax=Onchocerca ochengi TaxID=42157 RepID=A0A182EYJ7_ONCOC